MDFQIPKVSEKFCSLCGEPASSIVINNVNIEAPKGSQLRISVKGDYPPENVQYRCKFHFGQF